MGFLYTTARLSAPQVGQIQSDDPEEEKKQKAFTAQLNKLTPDNFDRILAKLLDVGVTSANTLKGLIDRVRFRIQGQNPEA